VIRINGASASILIQKLLRFVQKFTSLENFVNQLKTKNLKVGCASTLPPGYNILTERFFKIGKE